MRVALVQMGGKTRDIPSFATESALLRGACDFALSAHHGPARRGDTAIDHPIRVAWLLHEAGFEQEVVAAALLHDVVEDTAIDLDEIEARFGYEIASLVGEMTENEEIEPYEQRKAEHRERVAGDRRVAAIYAADKLANARTLNEEAEEIERKRIEHYCRTLDRLATEQPDLPFLGPLRDELGALVARVSTRP
jgi:guanosine-3',5'-bis(diphosphate) 3'-pyrophosphohydrolase